MTSTNRPHLVIGTAGHIDHGKSTLVKALTGMDPDRLREEKERGITIELGFAFYGDRAAFVDVPGHERLIKTMVAGASAMRAVMLVVAADDGVMPQTREHLAVLDAMGISRGIVAVTKASLASDRDWIDLVSEEIVELLKPTSLAGSPIIVTDAITGEGLEQLRAELDKMIDGLKSPEELDYFRMPVDRSFVIKGHGRVVTGTVWNGSAKSGDRLTLQPWGEDVRVRGLQAHESDVESVQEGDRAALNLTCDREPERGDQIVSSGRTVSTEFLDAEVSLLPDARLVIHRQRVHLHIGTGEVIGRLLVVGGELIEPGSRGFARIALEQPVPVMWSDRGVLRLYSPLEMLGGIRVLDPDPVDRRRTIKGLPERFGALAGELPSALEAIVRSRSQMSFKGLLARFPVSADVLKRTLSELVSKGIFVASGEEYRWVACRDSWEKWLSDTVEIIRQYHAKNPDEAGIPKGQWILELFGGEAGEVAEALLKSLVDTGGVRIENGRIVAGGYTATLKPEDEADAGKLLDLLHREGLNTPLPADIAAELRLSEERVRTLFKSLKRVGKAVILAENVVIATDTFEEVKATLRKAYSNSGGFSAGDAAKILGTSRKYIIPLLESLDSFGFTIREGDTRKIIG